jgi:hypothetical protein
VRAHGPTAGEFVAPPSKEGESQLHKELQQVASRTPGRPSQLTARAPRRIIDRKALRGKGARDLLGRRSRGEIEVEAGVPESPTRDVPLVTSQIAGPRR